jgi:hypothetical protein
MNKPRIAKYEDIYRQIASLYENLCSIPKACNELNINKRNYYRICKKLGKPSAAAKENDRTLQHGGNIEREASPQPHHTSSSRRDESPAKTGGVIVPPEVNKEHTGAPPLGYMEDLKANTASENITLDEECIDMMKFLDETAKEKIAEK